MIHALTRRSVTTGLAAAVTAIPAVGMALAKTAPLISPEERIRRALAEAKAAFEAYYVGAKFQASWYEARPEPVAKDGYTGCFMVIASNYSEEHLRPYKRPW
jgi:hypothetical protein